MIFYNVVPITLVMWAKLLLNSILSTNSRRFAQEERLLRPAYMKSFLDQFVQQQHNPQQMTLMNSPQWLAHFPATSSARFPDISVYYTSRYLKGKLCFFTLAFFYFHLTLVYVCLSQSKNNYFALPGHFLKSEGLTFCMSEVSSFVNLTGRLARRNKSVIFQSDSGP